MFEYPLHTLNLSSIALPHWVCVFLFTGCVFGLLSRLQLSRSQQGQGPPRSSKKEDLPRVEPTCCDFSEIEPLVEFNWKETDEVPYRPFRGGPYFLTMGLKPMPAEGWVELDNTYLSKLNYKRELFSQQRVETVASLPGSEDASFEALEMLADFLPRRYPSMFAKAPQGIKNLVTGEDWNLQRSSKVWTDKKMHPLEVMSLLTTDDWVVMQKSPEGGDEYHLRAGAVCFPSGWRISQRIGHSLYRIHAGNVPQYEPRLAKSMDRFFTNLKVASPIQRFNTSLETSPELFHIYPRNHLVTGSLEELTTDDLYLRVERQTLRRLPRSRALLFGIRTYVTPIQKVTKDREVARLLKEQIEAYPEDMAGYKNRHVWKVAVMKHLDSIL